MLKKTYEGMDLDLYYEKLDNGLDVYIVPMPQFTNIYATFTTKFGSIHSGFKFANEKNYTTVSDGIAHFLEHKMFENADGVDPFTFFGKSGTDTNANTSFYRTSYLFKGRENFDNNLNYLLDFVQTPYLTKENVLKEKGIITEEAKMYLDHPYWRLVETALRNTFINNPLGIPVIGTIDSINKITKEELMYCYKAFYHPSNMIAVISGPVNQGDVLKVIKDNQSKKDYQMMPEIEIKPFDEPNQVALAFEEVRLDVAVPKAIINYKINYDLLNLDLKKVNFYLQDFLAMKFGETSVFNNYLIDQKSIIGSLETEIILSEKHLVMSIMLESETPESIIELVKKEMLDLSFDPADLERKKKVSLAHLIAANENIEKPNERIFESIVLFGDLILNIKELLTSLNADELNEMLNKIDFTNSNVVIVKPINE